MKYVYVIYILDEYKSTEDSERVYAIYDDVDLAETEAQELEDDGYTVWMEEVQLNKPLQHDI